MTLRWINPKGSELWTSTGELNVGQPPTGVTEMDLPLIAAVDLPLDTAGDYEMLVDLDGEPAAAGDEVVLFEPMYDCYAAGIAMAGGVARPVPLHPPGDGAGPWA